MFYFMHPKYEGHLQSNNYILVIQKNFTNNNNKNVGAARLNILASKYKKWYIPKIQIVL
jgi:hypothetical protein